MQRIGIKSDGGDERFQCITTIWNCFMTILVIQRLYCKKEHIIIIPDNILTFSLQQWDLWTSASTEHNRRNWELLDKAESNCRGDASREALPADNWRGDGWRGAGRYCYRWFCLLSRLQVIRNHFYCSLILFTWCNFFSILHHK